ncbi:MAG: hypothetical protein WC415_04490 [Patescibacteria group bacterium]|jgi:hypothetical protein
MSETKQTLKSFATLFNETLKIFKTDWLRFVKMIGLGILGIVPLAVILGLFFLNTIIFKNANIIGATSMIILGFASLVAVIFAIYISIISKIGSFNLLKDRTEKILEVFKNSRVNFWGFVWISILTAILVMLWTVAFIIPGVIFGVYYSLAIYAFIFEGKTGMSAIKRSQELIKDYWWAFLGRILLFSLIIMAGYAVVAIIFSLPEFAIAKGTASQIIFKNFADLIGALFSAFIITPLYLIFSSLIYKNLVAIKGNTVKQEIPLPIEKV